jgi:hypothetical protein
VLRRVYQVAHENNMFDQVLAQNQPKRASFTDLIFKPGETAYFSLDGMWCAGCAVPPSRFCVIGMASRMWTSVLPQDEYEFSTTRPR